MADAAGKHIAGAALTSVMKKCQTVATKTRESNSLEVNWNTPCATARRHRMVNESQNCYKTKTVRARRLAVVVGDTANRLHDTEARGMMQLWPSNKVRSGRVAMWGGIVGLIIQLIAGAAAVISRVRC
jgi:hypothetical protein